MCQCVHLTASLEYTLDLNELLDSVGINGDTTDAGVFARDYQYGAALVVGFGLLNQDGNDDGF